MSIVLFYFLCHATLTFHQLFTCIFYIQLFDMLKLIEIELSHTLLPAIETTDVIGNTDNKQVKRNMSKYFQRMFLLISLSLGYSFYDTYSYFLKINVVLTICCVWWMCFGYREQQTKQSLTTDVRI